MKGPAALLVATAVTLAVTAAIAGHEFPVYPSYYPHEIRIQTVAPADAPGLLSKSGIHAYVGSGVQFGASLPDSIGAVDSLGSFIVVRVNPASPVARDEASTCAVARTVVRQIAAHPGEVKVHPYPVTPEHGDYLYHADLAEAAKSRLLDDSVGASIHHLRLRATGAAAERLARREWLAPQGAWDAAIEEVSAAQLLAEASTRLNGWLGPPWLKAGWFQAALLFGPDVEGSPERNRAKADLVRLQAGAYDGAVERINLERDLVRSLAAGCRTTIAGYTLKREYVSTEYSAGIENIGFDSIAGLDSPLFIRTVKLKDFPWNGWLSLGVDGPPAAAWNPVAGFSDGFGRLMWSTLADPALLPAPYDAGWIFNRISDVQGSAGR